MARNLAVAGCSLVLHDADPQVQARFVSEHGGVAADRPEAFATASVVVTMLPDGAAVQDAVLGKGGIGAVLAPGSVVVDMSSSSPLDTLELGAHLAERGVGLVDAPVSGGVPRAEDGTLTLMVGGGDELVERARPVLEVLGGRIFRTGPLGSGHAMKALNNLVGGATYAVAAEALAIGTGYGLDPRVMVAVMNASTGRSFNTEVVLQEHVLTGAYHTGFALGLLAKDVGIAAALAERAGVDAPLGRLLAGRLADAAATLGAGADHSLAHRAWWDVRFDSGGEDGG
jgi:3-hydroxyisobutyrate dehydrogenase